MPLFNWFRSNSTNKCYHHNRASCHICTAPSLSKVDKFFLFYVFWPSFAMVKYTCYILMNIMPLPKNNQITNVLELREQRRRYKDANGDLPPNLATCVKWMNVKVTVKLLDEENEGKMSKVEVIMVAYATFSKLLKIL